MNSLSLAPEDRVSLCDAAAQLSYDQEYICLRMRNHAMGIDEEFDLGIVSQTKFGWTYMISGTKLRAYKEQHSGGIDLR